LTGPGSPPIFINPHFRATFIATGVNDDPGLRDDVSASSEFSSTMGIILRCAVLATILTGGVWIAASYIIPYVVGQGR